MQARNPASRSSLSPPAPKPSRLKWRYVSHTAQAYLTIFSPALPIRIMVLTPAPFSTSLKILPTVTASTPQIEEASDILPPKALSLHLNHLNMSQINPFYPLFWCLFSSNLYSEIRNNSNEKDYRNSKKGEFGEDRANAKGSIPFLNEEDDLVKITIYLHDKGLDDLISKLHDTVDQRYKESMIEVFTPDFIISSTLKRAEKKIEKQKEKTPVWWWMELGNSWSCHPDTRPIGFLKTQFVSKSVRKIILKSFCGVSFLQKYPLQSI
jgi:hypothetical protein